MRSNEKTLEEIDNERARINAEFEAETNKEKKGELLLKWIEVTEKRQKIKSTKKERFALKGVKKFYKLGEKMGKWKTPSKKEIKK